MNAVLRGILKPIYLIAVIMVASAIVIGNRKNVSAFKLKRFFVY